MRYGSRLRKKILAQRFTPYFNILARRTMAIAVSINTANARADPCVIRCRRRFGGGAGLHRVLPRGGTPAAAPLAAPADQARDQSADPARRRARRVELRRGAPRRSSLGKAYQTPVEAYRTAEGTLILLPYGPVTDWCRNVLAAGQCTVTVDGQDLALSAPEVVPASVAEARVPADVARRWHRQGIAHYLWLKSVTPIEVEVEPALASASAAVPYANPLIYLRHHTASDSLDHRGPCRHAW